MTKRETTALLYAAEALLLLLCLLYMPYGFYSLVRFISAIAFCYFAYIAYKSGNEGRMILFIALAILFQPFIKIPLGRLVWNVVDIIVAIYCILLLVNQKDDVV